MPLESVLAQVIEKQKVTILVLASMSRYNCGPRGKFQDKDAVAPLRMVTITLIALATTAALGDDVLYRYEGDVFPHDESAGWVIANPCEDQCIESLENGHFVLRWTEPADFAKYHLWIARDPEQPPPNLWVEWHFRSSRPLERNVFTCDAIFTVDYRGIHDLVFM